MATELKMTLLLRRAEFADSCVLQLGEPGYRPSTKEFKVGDGSTTWKELPVANEIQIKGWISALKTELEGKIATDLSNYYTKKEIDDLLDALEQAIGKVASDLAAEVTARQEADEDLQEAINTKLATETFNNWKGTHETDHAPSATQIASDIAAAVAAEAALREAADTAITDTLGTGFDKGDNTVAKKITAAEAAAKAHAEAQASAAQSAAIAEAESKDVARAQAAATALSEAKTELEGKISGGDSATLAAAKKYTDEQVAAEAELRIAADNALDDRLDTVEAKLTNVSNVMDFVGAAEALPAEGSNQNGDVIVITAGDDAGKEFVYDDSREAGKKWVEFGSTSATDAAIAALQERMDAAEEDIDQAQADVLALGTNKMDKSAFTTWEQGFEADKTAHENDHAKKQTEITADIATAKSEAITEAGKLDTALHTEISKEIDADVKAAIDAEVTRSNAYADKAEEDAIATAASQADAKDTTLHTTITGEIATAKSEAIDAAKDYTDAREVEIKKYADKAETDAVATAKAYTDGREVEIKKYADQAETDAVAAANAYADTQDAATLTAAKAYADEKVAGAVTKVTAGNSDIVVTPAGGTGNVAVAHKEYGSGTYTKPDPVNDANFVTGVTIENGHVTGASVKSLAEALSSMVFVLDGGTDANTLVFDF